jgi:hypothetical protein
MSMMVFITTENVTKKREEEDVDAAIKIPDVNPLFSGTCTTP